MDITIHLDIQSLKMILMVNICILMIIKIIVDLKVKKYWLLVLEIRVVIVRLRLVELRNMFR